MGINNQIENDIEYIYSSYLLSKQDKHKEKYKKFKGWFSASTAGSCFRKQYFASNGYEGKETDRRPMRLMRLGTLVHEDVANAINKYKKEYESKGIQVFVEHQIRLKNFNVVGHLDLGFFDTNNNKLHVTDLKTAHSYKWKMMFGRNPEKNPSVNYYLQVATYGLGLSNELEIRTDNVDLSLTWYKKDDSMMRTQMLDNIWINEAINYWTELNDDLEDGNQPEVGDYNTPVYDWECKFCQFKGLSCEGI